MVLDQNPSTSTYTCLSNGNRSNPSTSILVYPMVLDQTLAHLYLFIQ